MDVATIGRNKRPGTVSIIGTAAVSTIKTVKTKLVIMFDTKFASHRCRCRNAFSVS